VEHGRAVAYQKPQKLKPQKRWEFRHELAEGVTAEEAERQRVHVIARLCEGATR